jgi:hypothetical protein
MRKADNLPPSSADVMESGSLNLPEPSAPERPVMGMIYLVIGYTANQAKEMSLCNKEYSPTQSFY